MIRSSQLIVWSQKNNEWHTWEDVNVPYSWWGEVKNTPFDYSQGRKYHYPICCIIYYCLHGLTLYPLELLYHRLHPKRIFMWTKEPERKCPYHTIKNILRGEYKIINVR
jgi:hypothetical protein